MTREEAIERLNIHKSTSVFVDSIAEAIDMAIEALSANAVQGVGRYENAMQKLRDMPRYLNGVKEKQITKTSANYTTEKPNGVVEQKNDVVAEPTDLISRAELLDRIKAINSIPWGDDHGNAVKLVWSTEEVKRLIEKAPSADRPSGEWVEKEVMVDEDTDIKEWQSAKCSVCGKYHTTPYMYYFDSFNYCPNCGAKMGGNK